MGIGHVRYPTAGSASAQEAQPFFVNSPLGIYMIHNGNLTNCDQLRTLLNSSTSFFNRHLRTDSDSEVCGGWVGGVGSGGSGVWGGGWARGVVASQDDAVEGAAGLPRALPVGSHSCLGTHRPLPPAPRAAGAAECAG